MMSMSRSVMSMHCLAKILESVRSCTVVDVEISSNVFGFVVNVNDSIIVHFLERRCYVSSE